MRTKLMAVALICSTFSCQKSMYYDEDNTTSNQPVAVQFAGKVTTRVVDNTWEDLDKVGIFMFESGSTLSDESVIDYSSNRKYAYSAAMSGFVPQTKNDTIYYPQTGEVDFIAYYPYGSVTDYAVEVSTSNQTKQSAIDFLYSNNLQHISKSEETLTLQFEHQLSKLAFSISAGEGFSTGDLTGLKLYVDELVTLGSFDLATGTLTADESSSKNLTALVSDDGTEAEAIVIPQACAQKRVRVLLSSGYSFSFEIGTTDSWEAMYKYTYNIVLTKGVYEVTLNGVISEWLEGVGGDLEESGSGMDSSTWDGSSISTDWYDAGLETYDISSADELAGLSQLVKEGVDFEGKTIRLTSNIDLNDYPWTPIGYSESLSFKGTFNGASHTIEGLAPQLSADARAFGLFGENQGTIMDVVVAGDIDYESELTTCYMAAVVGLNSGTVSGCRSYASVSGTLASTSASSSSAFVGGIAGINYGTLSDCQNYGIVYGENLNSGSSSNTYVGGIAGVTASVISNCENNQKVTAQGETVYAGGMAGMASLSSSVGVYAEIHSCDNYGEVVIQSANQKAYAGGMTGSMTRTENVVTYSNNYAEVEANCSNGDDYYSVAGGIIGHNKSATLYLNSNAGNVLAVNSGDSSMAAAGGIVGYNTTSAAIHTSVNESVATIQSAGCAGGIAGYNDTETGSEGFVYDCCSNGGTPQKWIGNASGSDNKNGVTTTEHTDAE